MHALRFVLSLSFLLLLQGETIYSQWQRTNGIYGGIVQDLAFSGTTLFAGTNGGGVCISTNNGTSWTASSTDLTNAHVNVLVVSPASGGSGTNLFSDIDS